MLGEGLTNLIILALSLSCKFLVREVGFEPTSSFGARHFKCRVYTVPPLAHICSAYA